MADSGKEMVNNRVVSAIFICIVEASNAIVVEVKGGRGKGW